MLGFIFLGIAMLVILAGCAGMMFLFLKMTQRRTEPYFQFEDDN
jgi:NADH:ubiquinone oxidoreductase subunit 6 (subunit J)